MSFVPPTGLNEVSCTARRSLTWRMEESSPISSRKIVPLFAASKSPLIMKN